MKTSSVLVVAAHPDDEVLGCGGTIAKYAGGGNEVHVVILAEGITSRDPSRRPEARTAELTALQGAAREAGRLLGVASIEFESFPDNRMDSVDLLEIVKTVEAYIDRHRPTIVMTHHAGDMNIDHRLIHQAVVTACRPLPGSCVETMLFFEVPSNTEWQAAHSAPSFMPTWYEDITETWEAKRAALEAYAAEMRPWPHPRSIAAVEHLARWRGASISRAAAEAFVLGRRIKN